MVNEELGSLGSAFKCTALEKQSTTVRLVLLQTVNFL